MIRIEIKVTPQQAADLVRGIARAIVTTGDVPEEAKTPQVVLLSCPEIGWTATAYAYDVVSAEPRYLLALDISRRIGARQIGTTRLRLMHMCNQERGNKATVYCFRRIEDDKAGDEQVLPETVEREEPGES
jgi:hypothetical protein